MPTNPPTLEIIQPTSKLVGVDKKLLADLESRVETGLRGVMEALHQLKNHKGGILWQSQGYKSFEEYCRTRFDFQKQHAYRLAAAGEFVSKLDTGTPLPIRESQVRPIINKIQEPEKRLAFWKELVEESAPESLTASEVEEKLKTFLKAIGGSTPKRAKSSSGDAQTSKVELRRERCHTLIGRLQETCSGLPMEEEILEALKELQKLVNRKRK